MYISAPWAVLLVSHSWSACLDKDLEYLTVWVPEHHSVTAAEYWTRGHSWTGPMGGGETQQDT